MYMEGPYKSQILTATTISLSHPFLSLSLSCTGTYRVLKSFYFGATETSLFKAVREIYQDAKI